MTQLQPHKGLLKTIHATAKENYVDFRDTVFNKLNQKAKERYDIEKVIVANRMFNEGTFGDPDRELGETEKELLKLHQVEELELELDGNENKWKSKTGNLSTSSKVGK